jgi:hypothetical protein
LKYLLNNNQQQHHNHHPSTMKACTPYTSLALAIVVLSSNSSCIQASSIQKPTNAAAFTKNKKDAFLHPSKQLHTNKILTSNRGGTSNANASQAQVQVRVQGQGGTATMSNEIFNLVKSIVGAGVLSLPAGIAAFGNAPSAVIPAVTLITAIGAISAYGFSLIGRVCATTQASSYREAWDKTVGTKSSWITAFSSTFSCIAANLAYSMILADTFQNLLATIGIQLTREQTLFGVTGLVLVPLCLLKDLSSLAPFSLLGIMGMAYTAIAMAVRFFGGDYREGGRFFKDVVVSSKPLFGNKGAMSVFSPSSFILISMLSTAYMVSLLTFAWIRFIFHVLV